MYWKHLDTCRINLMQRTLKMYHLSQIHPEYTQIYTTIIQCEKWRRIICKGGESYAIIWDHFSSHRMLVKGSYKTFGAQDGFAFVVWCWGDREELGDLEPTQGKLRWLLYHISHICLDHKLQAHQLGLLSNRKTQCASHKPEKDWRH